MKRFLLVLSASIIVILSIGCGKQKEAELEIQNPSTTVTLEEPTDKSKEEIVNEIQKLNSLSKVKEETTLTNSFLGISYTMPKDWWDRV